MGKAPLPLFNIGLKYNKAQSFAQLEVFCVDKMLAVAFRSLKHTQNVFSMVEKADLV